MIDRFLNHYAMSRRQGLGILILTLLACVIYMVMLGLNGYANGYYAAAAQTGSENWWGFLFGAVDLNASITTDKPPASIWITSLSVRLFGMNSYALLLPQAIMGVLSLLLIISMVKKHFGYRAGFIAGLAFLITPVTALIFRYNNPDALLTLLTILTVLSVERFNDTARLKWPVLFGVFVGLGFLTKTFQAFLILPALLVVLLFFGRHSFWRRLCAIFIASVGVLVTAGSWLLVVAAVPEIARPYIGGSQTNSALDLAFGYNGFGRLFGVKQAAGTYVLVADNDAGLLRMFTGAVGGEVGWLLPLALMTFVLAAVLFWQTRKTDTRFFDTLLYGGSLLSMTLVFSFMKGIFHGYYAVQLAPFLAAFIGIFFAIGQERGQHYRFRILLTVMIFISGIYSALVPFLNNDASNQLIFPIFALTLIATILLLLPPRITNNYRNFLLFVTLVALGAGPAFYTYATVMTPHTGSNILAGPYVNRNLAFVNHPKSKPNDTMQNKLTNLLTTISNVANTPVIKNETAVYLAQDADKYVYAAAAVGGQNAAAYQLRLDKPVLFMGGFNGTDPTPTFEQFRGLVAAKEIHYFILTSAGQPETSSQYQTTLWVTNNFSSRTVGNVRVYDLTKPLKN